MSVEIVNIIIKKNDSDLELLTKEEEAKMKFMAWLELYKYEFWYLDHTEHDV